MLCVCCSVESVWVGSDHHHHLLKGVRAASEFSPVNSVLIATAVMSTAVPHAVQIRVSTSVVPPSSLLIVSAVTRVRVVISVQGGELFPVVPSERISSVAVVTTNPQLVKVRLRL